MARRVQLDVLATKKGDGLEKAAAEAEAAAKATDNFGDQQRQAERAAGRLDRKLIEQTALVKSLGLAYIESGRKADLAALRTERASLRNLKSIRAEFETAGKDVLKVAEKVAPEAAVSFGKAFSEIPVVGAHPIALGLGAAVVAAGPYLSGLIGSVVGAAIGGGALAAGVLGASKSPAVRGAFGEVGATFSREFSDATASFQGPLIASADIFGAEIRKDMPGLKAMFGELSTVVVPLARGVAGFVDKALPGIEKAVHNAEPIIELVAEELPKVGGALGEFADMVTKSKGDVEALSLTFSLLESQLLVTGELIKLGGDSFHVFNVAVKDTLDTVSKFPVGGSLFTGLDRDMQTWLGHVDQLGKKDLFQKIIDAATELGDTFVSDEQKYLSMFNAISGSQKTADDVARSILDLKDAFAQNGGALTGNTRAAIDNRTAITSTIAGYEQQRESLINSGISAAYANQVFNDEVKALRDAAVAAGADKTALDKLVGNYYVNVNQTTYYRSVDLSGSPSGRGGGLVNVRGFMQSGGPVHTPGTYVVGEHGPELVKLPAGSNVYSAADSRAMLSSSPSYRTVTTATPAAQPVINLTLSYQPAPGGLDAAMLSWLGMCLRSGRLQLAVNNSGSVVPR